MDDVSTKKRKRHEYSKNEKEKIVEIFQGLTTHFPDMGKQWIMEQVAEYIGCALRTVERFVSERKKTGLTQPPKKRQRKELIVLNDRQKLLLQNIVRSLTLDNKGPTIHAVFSEVAKNNELPSMGRSKLYQILKTLNLRPEKPGRGDSIIKNKQMVSKETATPSTSQILQITDEQISIKTEEYEIKTEEEMSEEREIITEESTPEDGNIKTEEETLVSIKTEDGEGKTAEETSVCIKIEDRNIKIEEDETNETQFEFIAVDTYVKEPDEFH